MKKIFLVFGNAMTHQSLSQILNNTKGTTSIYLAPGCCADSNLDVITEVQKARKKSDSQISQVIESCIDFAKNENLGSIDHAGAAKEIANAGVENIVVVSDPSHCEMFSIEWSKFSKVSKKENHLTFDVNESKFNVWLSSYNLGHLSPQ